MCASSSPVAFPQYHSREVLIETGWVFTGKVLPTPGLNSQSGDVKGRLDRGATERRNTLGLWRESAKRIGDVTNDFHFSTWCGPASNILLYTLQCPQRGEPTFTLRWMPGTVLNILWLTRVWKESMPDTVMCSWYPERGDMRPLSSESIGMPPTRKQ